MESFTLNNFSPISFCLLLLLLLHLFIICSLSVPVPSSSHWMSDNPTESIVCALVNCGEGTCKASNASALGFDCECNPGWKKIQIGPLTFPSCVIPNCSVDFQCANGSPSPRPPPQLSPNCALVWCGDGTCVPSGSGYTCRCSQGSANLFNNTAFACFKECSFGVDCHGLGLGLPISQSPPSSNKPGPTAESGPAPASNCSRNLRALTMMVLATAILPWF